MTNPLIIDLSHHNIVEDFDAIRAGGTIGIIHKATEGTGFSDSEFWDRREAAREAGLEWASYHFLLHGDIHLQMENFLNKVQPQIGERLVIDYEHEDVTLDDLREAISYLMVVVPNCELTVYSGHTINEQLGNAYDELLAQTSLWIAHYTDRPDPVWPTGTWPTWTLWQNTDCAPCDGIGGPCTCDGNRFNGTVENAYLWFHPDAGPQPAPEPMPDVPVVRIDITIPEGVVIAITVNGEPYA